MPQTLSITHGDTDVPVLNETLGENLRRIAELYPTADAVVIRHQNIRVNYRQLWLDTTAVAAALLQRGIKVGDRVGVWSANRYEWVVVQYATARIGAILVNINPAYLQQELAFALQQSGIRLLFHATKHKQVEYGPMLANVRESCPELQSCVNFDNDWEQYSCPTCVDLGQLATREQSLKPDDPINIQYTSGTTGFPKGATLTHRNILNNAYHTALGLGYTRADRVCVPVPFYHCFGMTLGTVACFSNGACMVVPGETFQPRTVLEAIQAEKCTSLYGVPTMFRAILEDPNFEQFDVSSLRTGIMAGSPCPIELMKEVVTRLHMPEVAIGYGMTETSPLSTLGKRDDSLERRVGTVGAALPHVEMSVRDTGNQPVPRGMPGEFCARGYHVMTGYWNSPSATRDAIDADGWMHSGDEAVMDESGYIRITGRMKDLIIRGGENISPREVEAVLEQHPAVSEAQVVGVPSHRYGEEVMAWIKFRPGLTATETELRDHCAAQLAYFKRPRFWQFIDAFPMTVTGKIQKFKLRELAVALLAERDK